MCLKFKFLVGVMCGVCLKIGYYGFYGGFVIDYWFWFLDEIYFMFYYKKVLDI